MDRFPTIRERTVYRIVPRKSTHISNIFHEMRFFMKVLIIEDDELLASCSVYKEIYDSQYKKTTTGNQKSGKEA